MNRIIHPFFVVLCTAIIIIITAIVLAIDIPKPKKKSWIQKSMIMPDSVNSWISINGNQHEKEEHHLQVILCQYLDWNGYDFFSIPNGGLRHPRVGNALKAEGLKAGAADLFIVLANNTHHGLFIEVKFADGKQQPNQKKFQSMVEHHGYCYKIVRSLDDLIDVLRIFKSDPIIDQYQAGYRSGYMDGKLQEQILR